MWLAPLLLIVITVMLLRAGLAQKATLQQGELRTARVVEYVERSRAEITYGHLKLEVPLEDGSLLQERLPLPLALLKRFEGEEEIDVLVRPGAEQPVIVEEVARAQWRLSIINAAMAAFGGLLLLWGVGSWNRYLRRKGDPGAQVS
jgi:hypothetical protein